MITPKYLNTFVGFYRYYGVSKNKNKLVDSGAAGCYTCGIIYHIDAICINLNQWRMIWPQNQ